MESHSETPEVSAIGPPVPAASLRSIALHALAAAFMFVSPLVLFVPAALIDSGLRNGRKGLWGALAGAAAILALAGSAASRPDQRLMHLASLGRLVFEVGLPTVVCYALVRRGVSLGGTVLGAVLAGIGGFAITEGVMLSGFSYSPYRAVVENFRADALASVDFYRKNGMPADALELMRSISVGIANSFMPFLLISITVMMFLLSLVMLSRLPAGRATGAIYFFRNFKLPEALLLGFVAGGLAPLASGPLRTVGFNLLATVGFLYFLQGLAIFRALLVAVGARFMGMMLAYGMLMLLTLYGVAPFLLFLAGLFDPFFDFRHFNRKDDSHESHID